MGIVRNAHRLVAAVPHIRRMRCIMCGHRVGRFLPYRGGSHRAPALFIALEVVGSDIDNFECPRCGAHDRERHLLMYLRASGLMARLPRMRVLHFAPEQHLTKRIVGCAPLQYIRCDLVPATPDVLRVNIETMPFCDRSFDLVVANHVLEHVDDDCRALAEIHRVLRPHGAAILQTPYSPMLNHTWSDPGIVGKAARLEAYGQEDHVRLFGRDIFDRFASSGLRACIETHQSMLAGEDARALGVNPLEPFFLFRRDVDS